MRLAVAFALARSRSAIFSPGFFEAKMSSPAHVPIQTFPSIAGLSRI
jgi:hypothetical protein